MFNCIIRRWFVPFVCLFVGLISVFTVCIILVQCIPTTAIENNIESSCNELIAEGIYPKYGFSSLHRLDTQTDALTFNMLYTAKPEMTVESAMINNVYQNDSIISQAIMLDDVIHNNISEYVPYSYSRNWHGYQLFIRPLLTVTDFTGIKVINTLLLLSTLFILCFFLWKRISAAYSICFFSVFTVMNLFIMSLCMQYFTCIFIAMLGMIIILAYPKTVCNIRNTCLFFFTLGALCSYFDWFTIPQITYGLPFIIYYTKNNEDNPIKMMIIVGLAWLSGYGLTLVSKWAIGTIITDYNCFELALSSVKERMSTQSVDVDYNLLYAIKMIAFGLFYYGLGGVLVIVNLYSVIKHKNEWISCLKKHYWLLLLSCLVPLWYILIRNHSCLHFSLFAWRALIVSFYSLFLFSYYSFYRIVFKKKNRSTIMIDR